MAINNLIVEFKLTEIIDKDILNDMEVILLYINSNVASLKSM